MAQDGGTFHGEIDRCTTMPPETPKTFRSPAAHSTGGESKKGTGISSTRAEAPELATSRQDKIKIKRHVMWTEERGRRYEKRTHISYEYF